MPKITKKNSEFHEKNQFAQQGVLHLAGFLRRRFNQISQAGAKEHFL